jgi:Pyridoxamine 5'-phosphate oxidase
MVIVLPDDVEAVLTEFMCCEFATLARDGTAVAWPVVPLRLPPPDPQAGLGHFLLSTSIGFAAKTGNVRRDPRVSLLFSDSTGSGLTAPPTVLVQGSATVDDVVQTDSEPLLAHWRRVNALQPAGRWFSNTAPARWFMDWYYMRLLIRVTPHRVLWWPAGDTAPQRCEVPDVA